MKKKNGYMLVEIIVASALAFALAYFIMSLTINLKNKNDDLIVRTKLMTDKTIITNMLMSGINNDAANFECDQIHVNTTNKSIEYNGKIIIVDDYFDLTDFSCNTVERNGNKKIDIKIPSYVNQLEESFDIDIDYSIINKSTIKSYWCKNTSFGNEPYNLVYTGNCQMIDDSNNNFRIVFKENGTLTMNKDIDVDIFLVGGGGGGGSSTYNVNYSVGGGGGGYTKTVRNVSLTNGTQYQIKIGVGGGAGREGHYNYYIDPPQWSNGGVGGEGGATTFNNKGTLYTASGGQGGNFSSSYGGTFYYAMACSGGAGGSGGGGSTSANRGGYETGGNGGSNGSSGTVNGGAGQGTTTREFGEASGALYSGGGAGSCHGVLGSAGDGGGGASGSAGSPNTGGGGGGSYSGGAGGSGIAIIRNHR